jgi:hypothetical protein
MYSATCTDNARRYYVTAKRDSKYAFLLGPFETHQEALDRVEDVRKVANRLDPWTEFDAFGTGSLGGLIGYPVGRLNHCM